MFHLIYFSLKWLNKTETVEYHIKWYNGHIFGNLCTVRINLLSLRVTLCTTNCNIQKSFVLPTIHL
jgi:hypothetical protein